MAAPSPAPAPTLPPPAMPATSMADPSPSSSSLPAADSPWGTWLDLILASAVRRHGSGDWAKVALEVQSRCPTSPGHLLDPGSCRARFEVINRRFDFAGADGCVDRLRQIRVAELRREVGRYDLNIKSLEMKVKRLEEERERSLRGSGSGSGSDGADIAGGRKPVASTGPEERSSPEELRGGESCKESNSTDLKPVAGSGDDGGGGENGEGHRPAADVSETGGGSPAREFGESAAADSDVQSSAAAAAVAGGGGGGGDGEEGASMSASGGIKRDESEPLIKFLDTIRSTKFGSVFARRLHTQDGEQYTSMIRRHIDLEMVQTRLEQCGSSSSRGAAYSCSAEFFRDLLLLCSNALVFFPKASAESTAAAQLRKIVSKEISRAFDNKAVPLEDSTPLHKLLPPTAKLTAVKPKPDPNVSDSLLDKAAVAPPVPPIIVCRKRSSIAKANAKAEKVEKAEKPDKEDENCKSEDKKLEVDSEDRPSGKEVAMASKERTGVRGFRTNKSRSGIKKGSNPSGKAFDADSATKSAKPVETPDPETGKKGGKKNGGSGNTGSGGNMGKKRNAVDFLNRLKQSTPSTARVSLLETLKRSTADGDVAAGSSGGSKPSEQKGSGGGQKKGGKGGGGLRKEPGSGGKKAAAASAGESSLGKRNTGQGSKRGAAPPARPPAKRLKGEQPAKGKKLVRR